MRTYTSMLLAMATTITAQTLYATHYSGNVYTLSLNTNETNNDPSKSLTVNSAQDTCGAMPSWLTLDSATGVLYCSDETGNATTPGSLTALSAAQGNLQDIAQVTDVGSGVNSAIYHGGQENQFLAVAHYDGSAVTTFSLPLHEKDSPLQTFRYNLTGRPAPKPEQDASHPHQVLVDPTGNFIISPDLGMDLIHVFSIDKTNGTLEECERILFPAGSGPRHGKFVSKTNGPTMLYTVSELSGELTAFTVEYKDGQCPSFHKVQTIFPYPDGKKPPNGAAPAAIQVYAENIYVSLRYDQSYPEIESDAIATLVRSANGTVAFRSLTPSYGKVPRTLVVHPAGTLVAIGNQASASVVVVQRLANGDLGQAVGSVAVGEPGTVGETEGLSSVIWGGSV